MHARIVMGARSYSRRVLVDGQWGTSVDMKTRNDQFKKGPPVRLLPDCPGDVLRERRVDSVGKIMYTARQRVTRLLSARSAKAVIDLSPPSQTAFSADGAAGGGRPASQPPSQASPQASSQASSQHAKNRAAMAARNEANRTANAASTIQAIARQVLLESRERAAASWIDRKGVPIVSPRNGMGHYILPLQRVTFHYCSHYGDSAGLREYLRTHLARLARDNPTVEFVVEPRWSRQALIRAFYLVPHSHQHHNNLVVKSGAPATRNEAISAAVKENFYCIANWTVADIDALLGRIRASSGLTQTPFHQKVISRVRAVRPIWSPFHMANGPKNDPIAFYVRHHLGRTRAAAASQK